MDYLFLLLFCLWQVASTHLVARKRLIYVDNALHILPNDLWSFFKKQAPFSSSLARMILPGLLKRVSVEHVNFSLSLCIFLL